MQLSGEPAQTSMKAIYNTAVSATTNNNNNNTDNNTTYS